jgi:hypothetical protein
LFEEAKKSLVLALGIPIDYNVHSEAHDIEVKVEDKSIF